MEWCLFPAGTEFEDILQNPYYISVKPNNTLKKKKKQKKVLPAVDLEITSHWGNDSEDGECQPVLLSQTSAALMQTSSDLVADTVLAGGSFLKKERQTYCHCMASECHPLLLLFPFQMSPLPTSPLTSTGMLSFHPLCLQQQRRLIQTNAALTNMATAA